MEGFAPIYIPGPTSAPGNVGGGGRSDDTGASGGVNPIGSAAGTAIGVALTPVLGPFAPIAGGFLGGLIGGKGKGTPTGSNDGLQGALQGGIGSLFGSKSSSVSNQSVTTEQATNVNVQNVLGGRKFGNFNEETGEFDDFQALSDIFAIKEAQDQARLAVSPSVPAGSTVAPATTKKPLNFTPLIVVGGLAAVFFILRR